MRSLLFVLAAACGSTAPLVPDGPAPADNDAPLATDAPSTTVDPATDGAAAVTESTVAIPGAAVGRTLQSTLYVPSTTGPRPLVVISPGFQMARAQYASYARHLATWGFLVVLSDYAGFFPDHQQAADDISAVIDWAIANQSVDETAIATAGHSLGGKLSVFAASQDSRIRAVVAWDPVDSNNPSVAPQKMTAMTAAIAVIGETTNGSGGGMPCAPAADNFTQFYAAAPSPALSITVAGADHMDWVDDPSCFACGFCAPGTIDAAVVHTVSRRLDVAWLRRHLLDDTTMDPWLLTPPESGLVIDHR
jgi:predicted dienelactone hydrolase